MNASLVKFSGVKIASHSDLRRGATKEALNEKLKTKCSTKIGTWNIQTLLKTGKLENLKMEMERLELDILGISEVRWPNQGDLWSGNYRIIHTGTAENERGLGGVGIMTNKHFGKRIKGYVQYSERIMLVRFDTKPRDTVIIQVYMPTTNAEDDKVEEVYDSLDNIIEHIKKDENLILMGDWNASVGRGKEEEEEVVGSFGVGRRNHRGDRLIEFCTKHKFIVTNTLFEHHPRRIYTWRAPGDIRRAQLDYILVRGRYKNQVKDSRSYPGADIESDHNLVMMKCTLRFKKLNKKEKSCWDVKKLEDETVHRRYIIETDKIVRDTRERNQSNIEQTWMSIKTRIIHAAESTLGKRNMEKRKKWISDEVIEMIKERRKYKNATDEEGKRRYRTIRNKINRKTRQDKESYMKEICENIELSMNKNQMEMAYSNIRRFFNDKRVKTMSIVDRGNKLVFDEDKIVEVWKEYIEKLYAGERHGLMLEEEREAEGENMGEPILEEEFRKALKELKGRKAPGIDNISGELLKGSGPELKKALFELVREIYDTGSLPEDFTKCIIMPIPKKPSARTCNEYRTLSLIGHAAKIIARIVLRRIINKIEESLTEDQFGFRRNTGTREAILVLRQIIEKQFRKDKTTYIAFIDLEKAFDNVNWKVLFKILHEIGINYRDRRIIHNIYQREVGVISCGNAIAEANISKGVRQGCSLSPVLFNLYIQKAIDRVREEVKVGISVQGEKIDMIRFADDIAIITESEQDLQIMIKEMDRILGGEYDMKLNRHKTKVLVCNRKNDNRTRILIREEAIQEVETFKYLGSLITGDGRCKQEIKSRLCQAKINFNKRKNLFTAKGMSLKIRVNLIKTLIWSIALYGSETWTIGKEEARRIEAFEAWCYRRMLRISWRERTTNDEVFRRVGEGRSLMKQLKQRRAKFLGHLLRRDSLAKRVIEGQIEGRNRRGRPRLEYIKQIVCDMGCQSYVELKRKAERREEWRAAANQPEGC